VPGCRKYFRYALKEAAQKTILKVECGCATMSYCW